MDRGADVPSCIFKIKLKAIKNDWEHEVFYCGAASAGKKGATQRFSASASQLQDFIGSFKVFHSVLVKKSCLALSNQQACGRPYCFTGRSWPLGTCFSTGSMVPLFNMQLPRLRFLPYGFLATGSPRLTAIWFLCHRQSSLLATRSFLFFFFAGAVRAWSSDGHQSFCLDCPFPRMRI